jgi:hypothetical protein
MFKITKWAQTFGAGLLLFSQIARADEGMWPLTMIAQLQDKMTARGLKLTAEDIYSLNKSSLKDGVVRLVNKQGRMFCTGEIISQEGLFLTNHHCGYGAIQELSTPADNILRDGFWAKSRNEERPANFNIALLTKVEDVTEMVLKGIPLAQSEQERSMALRASSGKVTEEIIKREKEKGNELVVELIPFFAGNRYLAMYYEIYKDIRLVGTPPENMGKFGGDTDNWMWPRHTADFSMFRIYANKQNKSANFSKDNQPYAPKHFFPINTSGVSLGDYAMIMGYPGRTSRFAFSENINFLTEKERPTRVNLRRAVLDQYENYMKKDQKVRLMYADKHAGISNYWKKFLGERDGLKALKIAERRKAIEEDFKVWIKRNGKEATYGDVFSTYSEILELNKKYGLFNVYFGDGLANSQIITNALEYASESDSLSSKEKAVVERSKERLSKSVGDGMKLFREFYAPIERDVLEVVVKMTYEGMDKSLQPKEMEELVMKYKGDYKKLADGIMATSLFADSNKLKAFLLKPEAKLLSKDPLVGLVKGLGKKSEEIGQAMMPIQMKSSRASRLLQAGLMEMNPTATMGPDANGTMRLTYGRVLDYDPKDAVKMNYLCTHNGILEKYIKGDYEFDAPEKLIDMLKRKDFGRWADKDGNLPVCFLTDNDITGGNSGSPVINAKGELIGTAFDGNWEAISSDFAFEPKLQRTISLDIRYTMFIVEKLAGAGHLLNEMKLVQTMPELPPAPPMPVPPVVEELKTIPAPVTKPSITPAKKLGVKKGAPAKG